MAKTCRTEGPCAQMDCDCGFYDKTVESEETPAEANSTGDQNMDAFLTAFEEFSAENRRRHEEVGAPYLEEPSFSVIDVDGVDLLFCEQTYHHFEKAIATLGIHIYGTTFSIDPEQEKIVETDHFASWYKGNHGRLKAILREIISDFDLSAFEANAKTMADMSKKVADLTEMRRNGLNAAAALHDALMIERKKNTQLAPTTGDLTWELQKCADLLDGENQGAGDPCRQAAEIIAGNGIPQIPSGWKLVPVVPTDAMIQAYCNMVDKHRIDRFVNARLIWPEMLRTAPSLIDETKSEPVEILREMVRLADMGLEDSLKEPEENGNYAAYRRAKRFLASIDAKKSHLEVA